MGLYKVVKFAALTPKNGEFHNFQKQTGSTLGIDIDTPVHTCGLGAGERIKLDD